MEDIKAISIDIKKLCPDSSATLFTDNTEQIITDEKGIKHCKACNGTSVNYLDLD